MPVTINTRVFLSFSITYSMHLVTLVGDWLGVELGVVVGTTEGDADGPSGMVGCSVGGCDLKHSIEGAPMKEGAILSVVDVTKLCWLALINFNSTVANALGTTELLAGVSACLTMFCIRYTALEPVWNVIPKPSASVSIRMLMRAVVFRTPRIRPTPGGTSKVTFSIL